MTCPVRASLAGPLPALILAPSAAPPRAPRLARDPCPASDPAQMNQIASQSESGGHDVVTIASSHYERVQNYLTSAVLCSKYLVHVQEHVRASLR